MTVGLEHIDVSEELADLERLLRELILLELKQIQDEDWTAVHQVSSKVVDRWLGYRDQEGKTSGGALGPSLIHYASLGELRDLIIQHWSLFDSVFANRGDFDFALKKLMDLRNPDAHRRSLFRWQKHLVFGLAGEIRSQIVKFRSLRLDYHDYIPKFTLAHDDDGFYVVPQGRQIKALKRSGETIRLTVKASDPLDGALEYRFFVYGVAGKPYELRTEWSTETEFEFRLTDKHITDRFVTGAECRRVSPNLDGNRHDALVLFDYVVLPSLNFSN